jgi:hypothetical protein
VTSNYLVIIHHPDQTVIDPYATTLLQGYDHPGNPTPNGSRILITSLFRANVKRVVGYAVLECPTPLSSRVSTEHGIGVGTGHTALPQGHI